MKRYCVLPLIALIVSAGSLFAQTKTTQTRVTVDSATGVKTIYVDTIISKAEDITPRSNMITINPLKFIFFYNLNYYHRLSPSLVIGGGLQMPTFSSTSGFGVNAELRLYPSSKALRGFYVAPNVSFNSLKVKNVYYYDANGNQTSESPTATATSVGVLLGWQWFPGDEFAIGLGIGVDYYFFSGSSNSNYDFSGLSSINGTAPALRFDIGYAW